MKPHPNSTTRSLLAAALLLAAGVPLAAAPAAATHISISMGHDDLEIDHDQIVVTARDHSQARISPDGTLTVEGRRVPLRERDRQALVLYNQSIRRIEDRAVEIGLQGAGLAVHALTSAVVAVATGNEERAKHSVEAKAEDLKDSARQLCQELRGVQALQDTVAAHVAAFEPYAVLELKASDCRVDD